MPPQSSSHEDLATQCVTTFNRLALHTMNNTWVDTIWDGQFTESLELPIDYEEVIQGIDVLAVLSKLQELSLKWIKKYGHESDEAGPSKDDDSARYCFH